MNQPRSVSEAIRQRHPFESEKVEAFLTLVWAHDRVSEIAHAPLREACLSPAQYNVLRILRGSPDGLQTHEVAERMLTRAPNLTRLVDKLETKHYLERRRCSDDRRVIYLKLTREGLDLVDRLDRPMAESTDRALASVSPEDLGALIRLLNQIGSGRPPTPVGRKESSNQEEL